MPMVRTVAMVRHAGSSAPPAQVEDALALGLEQSPIAAGRHGIHRALVHR
jgi:hypothetical protein